MSKFLRTLAKAGLIELDEELPPQETEPENTDVHETVDDGPTQPIAPMKSSADGIAEGTPYQELYDKAEIKSPAFTAEKLLRVLEGLKAMDPATRKTAVLAMDAADETWTVTECVADARRKQQALALAKKGLAEHLSAFSLETETSLKEEAENQARAAESIRKQIMDLEALLERRLQTVADRKAALRSTLRATEESCRRESTRYDQEAARLQEVIAVFGEAGASSPVAKEET